MKSVHLFVSFLVAGVALVVGCRRVPPPPSVEKTDAVTRVLPAEKSIVDKPTPPTPAQLKDDGCVRRGALPDPQCTPGKANPRVTAQHICTPGFAKTVQGAPEKLKRKVLEMYGEPPTQKVSHLISLELGGSNDVRNLWPEREKPRPGLNEKNKAQEYLRRRVCQGHMTLEEAQRRIATDWMAVYESIP